MNSFIQNKLHGSAASPWANKREDAGLVREKPSQNEMLVCPKVKSVSLTCCGYREVITA